MTEHNNAYLSEIFSAIQGEGPLVGVRQIFVRFSACDIRCQWCDTPDSLIRNEFCFVENKSGSRKFEKIKNPLKDNELLSYIESLTPRTHHSISFTGGEPLLQHKFLRKFLPYLKETFLLPVYLETGGHRPDELADVIKFVDYISMDFKLPSSAGTGIFWDKHKQFLEISLNAKNLQNIWVKIVVTNDTLQDELFHSIEIIKSVYLKDNLEIFLQPVSRINNINPPDEVQLLHMQKELLAIYPKVRVIPQTHKLIGQK